MSTFKKALIFLSGAIVGAYLMNQKCKEAILITIAEKNEKDSKSDETESK